MQHSAHNENINLTCHHFCAVSTKIFIMLVHVVLTDKPIVIYIVKATDSTRSVGPAIMWVGKCTETFSLAPATKNGLCMSIRSFMDFHVYNPLLTLHFNVLPPYIPLISADVNGHYILMVMPAIVSAKIFVRMEQNKMYLKSIKQVNRKHQRTIHY